MSVRGACCSIPASPSNGRWMKAISITRTQSWSTDMSIEEKALELVRALARLTTPEEEFEVKKNADGVVEDDGAVYDDADEMVSDMGDDRLMDEYGAFMDFVREAKKIVEE